MEFLKSDRISAPSHHNTQPLDILLIQLRRIFLLLPPIRRRKLVPSHKDKRTIGQSRLFREFKIVLV